MLILGMRVTNLSTAFFTIDKIVDHARLQRSRAKQCHQCNNIFKAVGAELLNQLFHTPGLKLKNCGGFGSLHQTIGGLIIQGNFIDLKGLFPYITAIRINHAHRPIDNRQCPQTQEIELHKAGVFYIILVKLSDYAGTGFITINWREVSDQGWRNNHTTGMLTAVPRYALELQSHTPDLAGFIVLIQKLF